MPVVCKYCSDDINQDDRDVYLCIGCNCASHLSCMDDHISSAARLKGDNLFSYRCKACNFEGKDALNRVKLGWVQIIHLALYNLTLLGDGRQGFFRWKEEICAFIEKHWSHLMPDKSRTSTWASTVAGTLSVHSPKLFKSGQHVFKESGWWGLSEIIPPFHDTEIYKNYKSQSAIPISPNEVKFDKGKESDYGRGKRQRKEKKGSATENSVKIPKLKTTLATKNESANLKTVLAKHTIVSDIGSYTDPTLLDDKNIKLEPSSYLEEDEWQLSLNDSPMELCELDFPPSYELNSINFEAGHENTYSFFDEAIHMISQDIVDEKETGSGKTFLADRNEFQECTNDDTPTHENVTSTKIDSPKVNPLPLSIVEETEFLQKLSGCVNVLACDSSVRRLRRKLLNRKLKREMGLPVFSLDECVRKLMHDSAPESIKFLFNEKKPEVMQVQNIHSKNMQQSYNHPALRGVNVLDRFLNVPNLSSLSQTRRHSFFRLIGNTEDDSCDRLITSPYTARILKPYIRRDFQVLPPKLKILKGIRERKMQSSFKRWPIDYCYVQPKHIPAVNALCSEFFWPGIDVTECLQYPEFSCVVLYRKLLIGFAFMVPDVSYNEAYISFILVHPDWRRSGLATNMIYHLIQTCMGKDITLHVSPTNPSMMLYQKFGFKAEVLILDFYDKYVRENHAGCKHAFLLRLQR